MYNGYGHNGVDFRASIGTPVKAALTGVVKGIGDTDQVCPGASYGRWILLEHFNGLSTLYAHLSLIKISEREPVATGAVIGYSGATGYATGPHLHFTVYATQGVQVANRQSKVCGGTYRMPIADPKAYLNHYSIVMIYEMNKNKNREGLCQMIVTIIFPSWFWVCLAWMLKSASNHRWFKKYYLCLGIPKPV